MVRPTKASPTKLGSSSQCRRLIDAFVAQQRPDGPSHFSRQHNDGGVGVRSRQQAPEPLADPRIAFAKGRHRRPCTLDQHLAQVLAAALNDADEFGSSAPS
jgi:hypothetical protein